MQQLRQSVDFRLPLCTVGNLHYSPPPPHPPSSRHIAHVPWHMLMFQTLVLFTLSPSTVNIIHCNLPPTPPPPSTHTPHVPGHMLMFQTLVLFTLSPLLPWTSSTATFPPPQPLQAHTHTTRTWTHVNVARPCVVHPLPLYRGHHPLQPSPHPNPSKHTHTPHVPGHMLTLHVLVLFTLSPSTVDIIHCNLPPTPTPPSTHTHHTYLDTC